jgi:hypothetical protein
MPGQLYGDKYMQLKELFFYSLLGVKLSNIKLLKNAAFGQGY